MSWDSLYAVESTYSRISTNSITNTNTDRYKKYIKIVEQRNKIPIGLLAAIINVESAFKPYAININGRTLLAKGPVEALNTIERAISQNITNIDIGLAQINYRFHKDNFNGLSEILNPKTNIEYAGRLLSSLFKQHGSWNKAIRYYHSASPLHHHKYAKRVIIALIEEKGKIQRIKRNI